jgi:hypothetical protein
MNKTQQIQSVIKNMLGVEPTVAEISHRVYGPIELPESNSKQIRAGKIIRAAAMLDDVVFITEGSEWAGHFKANSSPVPPEQLKLADAPALAPKTSDGRSYDYPEEQAFALEMDYTLFRVRRDPNATNKADEWQVFDNAAGQAVFNFWTPENTSDGMVKKSARHRLRIYQAGHEAGTAYGMQSVRDDLHRALQLGKYEPAASGTGS